MTISKFFKVFGMLTVSVFVLAACRAEEQGRITEYEPGVYLGKPDTKLSTDLVRRLRLRASLQGNPLYRAGDGGSVRKSDVRRPSINRGRRQGNP